MAIALFLQQQTPMTLDSGWVGPVIAISLLIIAGGVVTAGIAMLLVLKEMKETIDRTQGAIARTAQHMRDIGAEGEHLAHIVRHEAEAFAKTGKRLRKKVRQASDRVEERLEDLDALYEVVYEEVSDTALTAASAVRTLRTGGKWVRRVKRFFPRSRRRK